MDLRLTPAAQEQGFGMIFCHHPWMTGLSSEYLWRRRIQVARRSPQRVHMSGCSQGLKFSDFPPIGNLECSDTFFIETAIPQPLNQKKDSSWPKRLPLISHPFPYVLPLKFIHRPQRLEMDKLRKEALVPRLPAWPLSTRRQHLNANR